ncbi:hypothetical protein BKA66DRAFT_570794 [Pyrenochaeta sp. MPI-SDFR-AT-0127]|nr:hypothetical protein BKA66DRAFT_570794 [Pyrenochaeta sp. MPI-SDFR-AT-0127]
MATTNLNFAVTKDGETYNKLQRPDDYLTSPTSHPPPRIATTFLPGHQNKRKRGQNDASGNKRMKEEHNLSRPNNGGPVRECGMRAMLPGVDDDEQHSDNSTNEAIAYLRSVRFEASGIPPLLVASTGHIENDESGLLPIVDTTDTQSLIYNDGVWIATDQGHRATNSEDQLGEGHGDIDPQAGCCKLLMKRFRSFRHQLAKAHSDGRRQITVGPIKNTTSAQTLGNKRAWLQTIDREYPTLDQVLQMDEQSLFLGLRSCASSLAYSTTISREKCCWMWTLLARTGDIGTLDHELTSRVRDLGLQAGRLGVRHRKLTSFPEQHGSRHGVAEDLQSENKKSFCNEAGNAFGGLQNANWSKATKTQKVATGENVGVHDEPPEPTYDQQDGARLGRDKSESEADMSLSDGEDPVNVDAEANNLERARARLLAQLGDRLVQSRVPSSRAEAEKQRKEQMRNIEPRKRITLQAAPIAIDATVSREINTESIAVANPDWDTMTAVDMILTVVAECYGQRDLLKFRDAW